MRISFKREQKVNNNSKGNSLSTYLWILSYLKPYGWQLFLVFLCSLIISASQLVIPKFIQYFIDYLLPDRNYTFFYLLFIGLIVVILIMFAATAFQNLAQRSLQENAARDLQYSIFQHLRKLGFSYFEKHSVGESLSLMNTEVTTVQGLYSGLLPWLVGQTIYSAISIGILLSINVKLTLIIFPCFLLYYLFGPYFERKATETGRQLSEERVKLSRKTYCGIAGIFFRGLG